MDTIAPTSAVDVEAFRLRTFVERLIQQNEAEVHSERVALADVAKHVDGNPKAVVFRKVGPEGAELAANVFGSRRRLAMSLGVEERELLASLRKRLARPMAPVEVPSSAAPVHQVVLQGDKADLTALPVHLQHDLDGAPYISATLDFAVDPRTGWTNVGMRRLMLRGRKEAGIDLQAPSDLRVMYGAFHTKQERLPIAFAVGFHPADAIAAQCQMPPQDELSIMGGVRGAPVPVVKCVTSDLRVPADAEMILEGYLDARGWVEPEGPYGEYVGYYGRLKSNPVFHLTAITMRRDALFQTVSIGGRHLEHTDTAQVGALRTEAAIWSALETAVREPVAVYVTASCGGMYNARLSLRQRVPGEARNAISAVFGSSADVKHVFVVDPDIDIFSHEQMDWALATRFQADKDLVIARNFRAVPLDPSLQGERAGAKAGFDLTVPFGKANSQEFSVPGAPRIVAKPTRQSVAEALASGPKYFRDLMEAAGSDDGREIVRALEPLYAAGAIKRLEDGRYTLAEGKRA